MTTICLVQIMGRLHAHSSFGVGVRQNHAGALLSLREQYGQYSHLIFFPSSGEIPRPLKVEEFMKSLNMEKLLLVHKPGFDCVEIHAGILLSCRALCLLGNNKRTDIWWIQKPCLPTKLVVEAAPQQVGPMFPILVRISIRTDGSAKHLEDTLELLSTSRKKLMHLTYLLD